MKTKNLMVFFLMLASILLISSVSAATTELANVDSVKVNGVYESGNEDVSVVAGETVVVEVYFTSFEDASDVRVKAELEGDKVDVDDVSESFVVEQGLRYKKVLTLRVPYELKDEVSEDLALNLKIWNGDFKTELPEITLRVQRPQYNADVMSISSAQKVEAGELYPVDVVIKNVGYEKLDDLYVSVKISALNIERTAYFGDLVAVEDDDYDDTERGRIFLEIPYEAEDGLYTLEVEVENSDLVLSQDKQIYVDNEFSSNLVATETRKVAAAGEEAEYNLLVVNPTNELKVYRVVSESSGDVTSSTNTEIVAVPAGLTKSITVSAIADREGEHTFSVNLFSGEELTETATFELSAKGKSTNVSVVALTVVLAIIFIVLVVVLVMLLRKKPNKSDDFGESYY